jgi:hypothetical protein
MMFCSRIGGRLGSQAAGEGEYAWLWANAHLPLFVVHDHPAPFQVGRELGVRATMAGPDTVNIPELLAAFE